MQATQNRSSASRTEALATHPSTETVIDLSVRPPAPRYSSPSGHWFQTEIARPAAFFVPLRIFMAVGWLRTFAEKVNDGTWWDGTGLIDFFTQQQSSGAVAFPFYEGLIGNVFRPGSVVIGWLILLLELSIGLALLTGTYTNLALLVASGLNVNFMLAGQISPAAFYLAIQMMLFIVGAGSVFGVDRILSRRGATSPGICLIARTTPRNSMKNDVSDLLVLTLVAAGLSVLGFIHAVDFGPGGVNDPGVVLGAVMAMCAATLAVFTAGWVLRDRGRRRAGA